MWRREYIKIQEVIGSRMNISNKIEEIINLKKQFKSTLLSADIEWLLKDFFYVDWSIKINIDDINELKKMFISSSNWKHYSQLDNELFDKYIQNLIRSFWYIKWNEIIFRNKNYYFMFDSVDISLTNNKDSINSYKIENIDFKQFKEDIIKQFNNIDQNLKVFELIFPIFSSNMILDNIDKFVYEFINVCWKEKIFELEKTAKSIDYWFWEKNNNLFIDDSLYAISILDKLWILIGNLWKHPCEKCANNILKYYSQNHSVFGYLKNTFNVDVDILFRNYTYPKINNSLIKIFLWLLDAKINIYSFMQNLTHLLLNENFLNPSFEWRLILKKGLVNQLKKTVPKEFKNFKDKQVDIAWNKENIYNLASEIENHVDYYLDILVWDKPESMLKCIMSIDNTLPELTMWVSNKKVDTFENTFILMDELFKLIDALQNKIDDDHDLKIVKYEDKKKKWIIKEDKKAPEKDKIANKIKWLVMNKILRLYREENDPIIMIKTAQNAYLDIHKKWFTNNHILHLISVNYWWSLTWYFAKSVFKKLSINWRLAINTWNIVFSLYDVGNVNDFLKFIEYPFEEFLSHNVSEEIDENIKKKNRLLIFDDNTYTWETLSRLSALAEDKWKYWKVDYYACRAWIDLEKYYKWISEKDMLSIIWNAAWFSRQTIVNKENLNYKELVWTIVWSNIKKNIL